MISDNLTQFLEQLKKKGDLVRITHPVSSSLEMTEITHRVVKKKGPALLFENVKGKEIPVAINLFGTKERMALSLGVQDLQEVGRRIQHLTALPQELGKGFMARLSLLPQLKEFLRFPPRRVKEGPVQEVIWQGEEVDLFRLPILKCWPGDAGPFITLPLVITRDVETKTLNMGMYRMQCLDRKTTGMHWHIHKGGAAHLQRARKEQKPLEVAVALGGDPITIYSATAPCPGNLDEFLLAGFLRRKPVDLVPAKTVDLPVPAQAEIVLEGYVDPQEELLLEGPFGDHTGYYSPPDWYPRFHVTAITHRRKPIYPATVVGPPPMEDYWLGYATERIFLPLAQLILPEMVDFHMPPEGVFHNLVFVSIEKEYPGHALKVANGLLGLGLLMLTKVLVIFDAHVPIQDTQQAWWVALSSIDPQRDITFVPGPLDALDHASHQPLYGSRMIIDATTKWKEEGFTRPWPEPIAMDKKTRDVVDRIWDQLGI